MLGLWYGCLGKRVVRIEDTDRGIDEGELRVRTHHHILRFVPLDGRLEQ